MKKTNIEWTNSTVNFWGGCHKVSQGCKNCYMYRLYESRGRDPRLVVRVSDASFYLAKTWNDPRLIFTCSMSDFFIEDADQWRNDAWEVIKDTPQHTWQVLTKRVERILHCLPNDWGTSGYENVWLGVSIEDQNYVQRMVNLAKLKIPGSRWRAFLSIEPIIGEVDLMATDELTDALKKIDWVIIGGESGDEVGKHSYRPSEVEWYQKIISQCESLNIPVYVKQVGTHLANKLNIK